MELPLGIRIRNNKRINKLIIYNPLRSREVQKYLLKSGLTDRIVLDVVDGFVLLHNTEEVGPLFVRDELVMDISLMNVFQFRAWECFLDERSQ